MECERGIHVSCHIELYYIYIVLLCTSNVLDYNAQIDVMLCIGSNMHKAENAMTRGKHIVTSAQMTSPLLHCGERLHHCKF